MHRAGTPNATAASGPCGDAPRPASPGSPATAQLTFTLTDAGCDPIDAEAAAGPITFEAENASSNPDVHELEVLDGETVLGETPDLREGDSGSFTLTLEQGEYTLLCPGTDGDSGTLTVSGDLETESSPEVEDAIADYRSTFGP